MSTVADPPQADPPQTEANERVEAPPGRRAVAAGALAAFLELLALTGIAITQPVLDLFGRSGEILVARQASRADIVAFGLAITFLPAVVLWTVEMLVGLIDQRLRRAVHFVAVAFLATAIASLVLKRNTDFGSKILPPTIVAIGLALAYAFSRWSVLRTFTRFLAAGALAFLALFLFSSPTSAIVLKGGSVSPAEVAVGNPAPVVMIVFDELPTVSLMNSDGEIDADLYPNFASLAGDGSWYRNNTTVAPHTNKAVPAILTGRYPEADDELAVIGEYPDNLFTLLGESYAMNVVEQHTGLCPEQLCSDTAKTAQEDVGQLLGEASALWSRISAPRPLDKPPPELANDPFRYRVESSRDFTAAMSDEAGPRLDFMHLNLPHAAFEFLPDGTQYFGPPIPRGGFFGGGGWFGESGAAARQRHLLQTQFTDAVLGRVLDRMEALNRYDESLIVVTADHGASFREGQRFRALSEENYPDLAWTPLIVKQPGQDSGEVIDDPIRSIDIVPTIADVLDVEVPWKVDGQSVLGARRPRDEELRIIRGVLTSLETSKGEDYVTLDGERGFEEVLASRLPREGDDSDLRLYRLEPYGGLVGRRLEDLEVETRPKFEGRLDGSGAFGYVDLDSGTLPAYVSGEIEVTGQPSRPVAVSVNGVVGGWGYAYFPAFFPSTEEQGPGLHTRRFWTMVPPSLFREGNNEIELHLVEGEPGSERLEPIRLPG